MRIKSINLMALITIPLSLYLMISGLVDWEIIALVWVMEFELNVSLRGGNK